MSEEDKVVSLDRLREKRRERREQEPAGEAGPAAGEAGGSPPPHGEAGRPEPIPARLYWLHCPTCDTLEYTEEAIPGGRRHKCGTVVAEAEVEIDARAEHTIAAVNLERIRTLTEYLEAQRRHYEEYQRRLRALAGEAPAPYPLDEDTARQLPIEGVDPMGLLISKALHEPEKRFRDDEE